MRKRIPVLIALMLVTWARPVIADDITVETVLADLNAPRSVAIRPGGTPERYEVFVADRGAQRIVKMWSNEPKRATVVVTGFPAAADSDAGTEEGNPFSLLFLDEKHLVVGMAGAPPELRVYEFAAAGGPLAADAAKQRVTPQLPDEGACLGLARTRSNDFVADMLLVGVSRSGLWKVPVRANMLGEMSRLEGGPGFLVHMPLAISEQGYLLAVDDSSRSIRNRFLFLNPTNGQVVHQLDPRLTEVSGVAYSPNSGNLYAIAKVYGKDEEGLFRLDDAREPGGQAVTVTKLANIREPTAMAFGPDGALYVTALADKTKGDGGELLKVTGEL
jgi:hypothetical protein